MMLSYLTIFLLRSYNFYNFCDKSLCGGKPQFSSYSIKTLQIFA